MDYMLIVALSELRNLVVCCYTVLHLN